MSFLRKLWSKEGLLLGYEREEGLARLNPFKRAVRLTEAQINHHVQVVGASGFGKTVLLKKILKHKISKGGGLFFVDLKSDQELMNELEAYAEVYGRKGDVVRFSVSAGVGSASYNFLANGEATELRDRLMVGLNWSEEYYRNVASSHLLKILKMFCFLKEREGFDFGGEGQGRPTSVLFRGIAVRQSETSRRSSGSVMRWDSRD